MHIEPGIVDGAKLALSYATASGAAGIAGKMAFDSIRRDGGLVPFTLRSLAAAIMTFASFEILPHAPVGVSEVHLILGTTLFLMFGAGPAAVGLALGLLVQGLFFAPFDLPQFGMNVTTLLVPLMAMSLLANKIIPARTAYKDVGYGQALQLSLAYQGGIVAWVAFWAVYGQGFGAANLVNVASFGMAYLGVVLVEPLVDLAILAGAKQFSRLQQTGIFQARLYSPAA